MTTHQHVGSKVVIHPDLHDSVMSNLESDFLGDVKDGDMTYAQMGASLDYLQARTPLVVQEVGKNIDGTDYYVLAFPIAELPTICLDATEVVPA